MIQHRNGLLTVLLAVLLLWVAGCKPAEMMTDRTGMGYVLVQPGSFDMGGQWAQDSAGAMQPVHQVGLTKPFYISATEVTVAQYFAFCQATNRQRPIEPPWGWQDNLPVVNISWYDALAYTEWVGGRLPTEAEWEYAAKGGHLSQGHTYSGGNELQEVGWFTPANSTNSGRPQPVGGKQPNELGLFDMSGNVLEWTNDWFMEDYYANSPAQNPQGPGIAEKKVAKGGSWNMPQGFMHQPAMRLPYYPYEIYVNVGFRVARNK